MSTRRLTPHPSRPWLASRCRPTHVYLYFAGWAVASARLRPMFSEWCVVPGTIIITGLGGRASSPSSCRPRWPDEEGEALARALCLHTSRHHAPAAGRAIRTRSRLRTRFEGRLEELIVQRVHLGEDGAEARAERRRGRPRRLDERDQLRVPVARGLRPLVCHRGAPRGVGPGKFLPGRLGGEQ
eukprot:7240648-Prymnesium_polylepis.1